jgi:hypothetical protein
MEFPQFSGKKYIGHLRVTITDTNGGGRYELTCKGSLGMTVEEYYQVISQMHPDCFVNMYWSENGHDNFICGQPVNMIADELLMDEGKMMMDEYMCKWYPEIAGPHSDIHGTLSN